MIVFSGMHNLLVPSAISRAVNRLLREGKGAHDEQVDEGTIRQLLDDIMGKYRADTQAQYIAKRSQYLNRSGQDPATIGAETIRWFDDKWTQLESRCEIAPGKLVLKDLRTELANRHKVTLTDARIIGELKSAEVPCDLREVLEGLDVYRSSDRFAE